MGKVINKYAHFLMNHADKWHSHMEIFSFTIPLCSVFQFQHQQLVYHFLGRLLAYLLTDG